MCSREAAQAIFLAPRPGRLELATGRDPHSPNMSLSGTRSELRVARQELERLHDLISQRHQDLANRVDDFEVAKRRWKMRMQDSLRDLVTREERRVKHVRAPRCPAHPTGLPPRSRNLFRRMRRSFRA